MTARSCARGSRRCCGAPGSTRSTDEITAVVLVSVPLAFLLGILRTHFARAGMADLVVALQQATDSKRLGELLAKALGDRSLELVYCCRGSSASSTPTGGRPSPAPDAC